jgi:hypothetical protein
VKALGEGNVECTQFVQRVGLFLTENGGAGEVTAKQTKVSNKVAILVAQLLPTAEKRMELLHHAQQKLVQVQAQLKNSPALAQVPLKVAAPLWKPPAANPSAALAAKEAEHAAGAGAVEALAAALQAKDAEHAAAMEAAVQQAGTNASKGMEQMLSAKEEIHTAALAAKEAEHAAALEAALQAKDAEHGTAVQGKEAEHAALISMKNGQLLAAVQAKEAEINAQVAAALVAAEAGVGERLAQMQAAFDQVLAEKAAEHTAAVLAAKEANEVKEHAKEVEGEVDAQLWHWEDGSGGLHWKHFGKQESAMLEHAYHAGVSQQCIQIKRVAYHFDLQQMVQTNEKTGYQRHIKRITSSRKEGQEGGPSKSTEVAPAQLTDLHQPLKLLLKYANERCAMASSGSALSNAFEVSSPESKYPALFIAWETFQQSSTSDKELADYTNYFAHLPKKIAMSYMTETAYMQAKAYMQEHSAIQSPDAKSGLLHELKTCISQQDDVKSISLAGTYAAGLLCAFIEVLQQGDRESTLHQKKLMHQVHELRELEAEKQKLHERIHGLQMDAQQQQEVHDARRKKQDAVFQRTKLQLADAAIKRDDALNREMLLRNQVKRANAKSKPAGDMLRVPLDEPAHWSLGGHHQAVDWGSTVHQEVVLDTDSDEFRVVAGLMNVGVGDHNAKFGTVDGNDPAGFEVTGINRIHNKSLWHKYCFKREELINRFREKNGSDGLPRSKESKYLAQHKMLTPLLDARANEYWLWHGTDWNTIRILITSGYDARVGSLSGMFGGGFYLAENSSKSNQYIPCPACGGNAIFRKTGCMCKNQSDLEYGIILYRATLGQPFICQTYDSRKFRKARRPPTQTENTDLTFDSVLAEKRSNGAQRKHYTKLLGIETGKVELVPGLNYREAILYDSGCQAYPEYLVKFKRSAAKDPQGLVDTVDRLLSSWIQQAKGRPL